MDEILKLFIAGWLMCATPTMISEKPYYFFYHLGDEITMVMLVESDELNRFMKNENVWGYELSQDEITILYKYSDNIIRNWGKQHDR